MFALRRRALAVAVVTGLAVSVAVILAPGHAQAHGKEVRIVLRCAPSERSRPLDQRCTATVVYAGDGETVDGARLVLDGSRSSRGDHAGPVSFAPAGDPGSYVASLLLPAYGAWTFTATMEAPAEGRVLLDQEVLPPVAGTSPTNQARAQLLIRFNARDVANLVALLAHLLGTLALFSAIGAVALIGATMQPGTGLTHRRWLARWFPAVAASSFGLIIASGVYNALHNAPTRSPGLLHPGTVAALPYGTAYLIAFGTKMALALALLIGTLWLAVLLRRSVAWRLPAVAGGAVATEAPPVRSSWLAGFQVQDACVRIALADLAVGGALLLSVVVVDYLHLLSHVGVFAGG